MLVFSAVFFVYDAVCFVLTGRPWFLAFAAIMAACYWINNSTLRSERERRGKTDRSYRF